MRLERRLKPSSNIDMTPLIDIVYQLVIFFMITSVFKVAPGINLNLPGSTTSVSVTQGQVKVLMLSNGEIWVNEEQATLKELEPRVRAAIAGKAPKEINAVIEADRDVAYQKMITALDAFRANGIEGVALTTRSGQDVESSGP